MPRDGRVTGLGLSRQGFHLTFSEDSCQLSAEVAAEKYKRFHPYRDRPEARAQNSAQMATASTAKVFPTSDVLAAAVQPVRLLSGATNGTDSTI